tara:strand:+ start:1391 stop:2038 length:648 start_codon:yes stop_codon:yes gene_type:complete
LFRKKTIFFSKQISIRVLNKKIYNQAYTHKSYDQTLNNERLEFLGDSLLNLVVSEELFLEKKLKKEGDLSKKRAFIVSRKNLNEIAEKIILKSKIKSNLKSIPTNIYGNILEALIGAIYIDQGLDTTKKFIKKYIIKVSNYIESEPKNYKGELMIKAQQKGEKAQYKLLEEKGPDHQKEYIVAVFLANKLLAQDKGTTIKEAEQKAAKKALKSVF